MIHLEHKRLTHTFIIASLDKNPRVLQELGFDRDRLRGEKIWQKKVLHNTFFLRICNFGPKVIGEFIIVSIYSHSQRPEFFG